MGALFLDEPRALGPPLDAVHGNTDELDVNGGAIRPRLVELSR